MENRSVAGGQVIGRGKGSFCAAILLHILTRGVVTQVYISDKIS